MPEPLRSPKQSRVAAKNRSHPYARPANGHRVHDAGLQRSNSLLGTIKSFVTAPLAWLSLSDSQQHDDPSQKRRVSGSERGGTPPRAKRARRDSPDGVGYLDPPDSLFVTAKPTLPLLSHANGVPPTRTMSIDSLRLSSEPYRVPLRPARGHSILSRTSMSMEPQGPSPIRRSTTRDLSMPPPSPFARSFSRSSLTPQPAGATFGPSPKRKQRDSTAPPLLGSSTPTPSFTRPPPSTSGQQSLFPRALSRERSEGPISALLSRSTQSVSPMRESPSRSMLIRDEVHMGSQSKNTAERTLSTLESFRTPLHISRFPSAPPLAAEHQPRKVHVPMPSKLRFDHTPEGRKDKAKRTPMIIGPYSSGLSGMRKLLARRREEIERHVEAEGESEAARPERSLSEEAEMEYEKGSDKGKTMQAEAAAEAEDSRVSRTLRPQVNGTVTKADVSQPRTRSPPRSKADGLSSTLRTPSSRVSRTHAPAPKLKKARNKFSLNDDDDEPEWSMSVEEVKDYQAQLAKVQPPMSFGATRSMSEAGMQTDMDTPPVSQSASPPPLPAQPQTFDSLLSRIDSPGPAAAKPTTGFPPAQGQFKPDSRHDTQSPTPAEASSAPATLPFSLGAPTTVTPKPAEENPSPFASKTTTPVLAPAFSVPSPGPDGVPTFFANSKAQFTPPKVPSGSLFGSSPVNEKKDKGEPKNVFAVIGEAANGEKRDEGQPQKEPKPSPFGSLNKPSTFGGSSTPAFGSEQLIGEIATRPPTTTSSPFSGFGNTPTSKGEEIPKPTLSAPVASGPDMPKPGISIFGAASTSNATPTSTTDAAPKSTFSFGAPPSISTPSMNKPDISASTPASEVPSKPAFSFGAPTSAPPPAAEPPKPPFSFGSPASTQPGTLAPETINSPFSFGAAPSTPPPADKKPVNTFSFGNSAASTTSGFSFGSTPAPNGGTDGAKPAFSGFGNATASTTNLSKTPEPTPAEGGDGMEMNGDRMEESPTRSVDKKDVLAPQLTQSSSFAGFGSGGSGFSFGQDKPGASSGTFSFGQPKPLPSTGTSFTFGQPADKSTPGPSTSSGFTFGNDTSKVAGQSQQPFGAPVTNPFGGAASNPTNSPSFSFGQPSTSTNANPFGQPQQPENSTTPTPSSPSLFPQPTLQSQTLQQSPSFSFTPQSGNPFSSPATGATTPSSPTIQPFQFGSSGSAQPQPQSQAGAAGNTMFTLGGAATPPRRVKGLPSRRGTKRS